MISAGLGWFAGGLKVFFPCGPKLASRVDQKLFSGWKISCFSVGPRMLSAGLGWFAGGLKVSFRVV